MSYKNKSYGQIVNNPVKFLETQTGIFVFGYRIGLFTNLNSLNIVLQTKDQALINEYLVF